LAWLAMGQPAASADEGGTSFWLPGQYASLAATPADPGWSLALIYYHASLDGEGSKEFSLGNTITLGVDVGEDLLLLVPTYTFHNPVLGGQAAISMAGVYGGVDVGAEATLTGPGGEILSGSATDSTTAFGDLYPSVSLRWNHGVHNSMAYTMLGVPVGSYDPERLASVGTNHWAVDAGGGYTYFNTETGREFSAAGGLTYNFENPDTHYKNGINAHLDWGASQFVSDTVHVGLVGYFYHQLTGDRGAGAVLGNFKSRVNAIGPQFGYLFKMGKKQAYLNVKGYWEFGGKYRPEGWNTWLTVSVPIGG
jgi:hypothetical protein